jgi:hypothetical protein
VNLSAVFTAAECFKLLLKRGQCTCVNLSSGGVSPLTPESRSDALEEAARVPDNGLIRSLRKLQSSIENEVFGPPDLSRIDRIVKTSAILATGLSEPLCRLC